MDVLGAFDRGLLSRICMALKASQPGRQILLNLDVPELAEGSRSPKHTPPMSVFEKDHQIPWDAPSYIQPKAQLIEISLSDQQVEELFGLIRRAREVLAEAHQE